MSHAQCIAKRSVYRSCTEMVLQNKKQVKIVIPLCEYFPHNGALREGYPSRVVLLCAVEIHHSAKQPQAAEEQIVKAIPVVDCERLLQELIKHTTRNSTTSTA